MSSDDQEIHHSNEANESEESTNEDQPQSNASSEGHSDPQEIPIGQPTGINSILSPLNRQLYQELLIVHMHVDMCLKKESEPRSDAELCTLVYCRSMKNMLTHMKTCQEEESCIYSQCKVLRKLVYHWNHCKGNNCALCSPVIKEITTPNDNVLPRQSVDEETIDATLAGVSVTQIEPPAGSGPGQKVNVLITQLLQIDPQERDVGINIRTQLNKIGTRQPFGLANMVIRPQLRQTTVSEGQTTVNAQRQEVAPSGGQPNLVQSQSGPLNGGQPSMRQSLSGAQNGVGQPSCYQSQSRALSGGQLFVSQTQSVAGAPNYPRQSRSGQISNIRFNCNDSLEETKRKIKLQWQIFLLKHAEECKRRDIESNGNVPICPVPYCSIMKNVLNHMTTCQALDNCTEIHCSTSRKLLIHWEICRPSCQLCAPMKLYFMNRDRHSIPEGVQQTTGPLDMRIANDSRTSNLLPNQEVDGDWRMRGPVIRQAYPGTPAEPGQPVQRLELNQFDTSYISQPLRNGLFVFTGTGNLSAPTNGPADHFQQAVGIQQLSGLNLSNQTDIMYDNRLNNIQLPPSLEAGQVRLRAPLIVQGTNEFHNSMTLDLSNRTNQHLEHMEVLDSEVHLNE